MTMFCDQTTRSKLARRRPNARAVGSPHSPFLAASGWQGARAFRIHGSFCHKNDADISVVLRMLLVSGATMMRTSVILVAVTSAVLGGTLIASAQVSSGSPDAAQQNLAKKNTTDKPVQNDQQNATTNRRSGR